MDALRILCRNGDLVNLPLKGHDRCAIHLLTLNGNFDFLEVLLQNPETDVTVTDGLNRMAIHYATSNSKFTDEHVRALFNVVNLDSS